MKNPKMEKLLAAFCWCGTVTSAFLFGYMLHLSRTFPGLNTFERNVRITGVLLLIWVGASVYFSVQAYKSRKKQDK